MKLLSLLSLLSALQGTVGFAPVLKSGAVRPKSELSAELETNAVLAALDAFYQTEPYTAAFLTCSIKASAADLVAQQHPVETDKEEQDFDGKRNIGLMLYGGLYQGMCEQFIYSEMYPSLFGDSTSIFTILQQVFLDMAVLAPFVCLPLSYATKGLVKDGSVGLAEGLERYLNHVQEKGLLLRFWSIWVPVQCVTFSIIPMHLRIPFIAFISFFWMMLLSHISSQAAAAQAVGAEKAPQTS
jgi:protein Mpv17